MNYFPFLAFLAVFTLLYFWFFGQKAKYKAGDVVLHSDGLSSLKIVKQHEKGYIYQYITLDGRPCGPSDGSGYWLPTWYVDRFYRKAALLRAVK